MRILIGTRFWHPSRRGGKGERVRRHPVVRVLRLFHRIARVAKLEGDRHRRAAVIQRRLVTWVGASR